MIKAAPTTRTALAVRHVHFETLGTFEQVLDDAGFVLDYCDVASRDLALVDPLTPDLLVLLGGPVGVYETAAYPFLEQEITLIKARLDAGLPILGICLGAQLIASALGARVAPAGVKEIGRAAFAHWLSRTTRDTDTGRLRRRKPQEASRH